MNKEINKPILEDNCAVTEFAQKLTEYRNKYEPERLLLQKKSPHSLQLKLFEEQATRESLVAAFEDAEVNAIKYFKISESEVDRSRFLNLIFQVFAARVLEDKRIISRKANNVN